MNTELNYVFGSALIQNMDDANHAETSDDGTTNDERASWAEVALLAFAQRTRMAKRVIGDKEDAFLIVSDLLTDLAHWCDRHQVDLPAALTHAAQHYLAETDGTGKQFKS
jgi:hypothetical protein